MVVCNKAEVARRGVCRGSAPRVPFMHVLKGAHISGGAAGAARPSRAGGILARAGGAEVGLELGCGRGRVNRGVMSVERVKEGKSRR